MKRDFSEIPVTQITKSNMAEHGCMGKTLGVIMQRLQEFAPLAYASSWDNVGLLVDPNIDAPIDTILLTNDLTEDIVEEAKCAKASLIISYHPNIFQGLKSVAKRTWKERIVVECIKNGIAVFSPHTSWDAVSGGVNDWLARSLPVKTSMPILQQIPNMPHVGPGRYVTLSEPVSIKMAVGMIKQHIGIKHLRLALGRRKSEESLLFTMALCAGSGSTILNGVEADLFLTGEMMHHDILDATQRGISVILCNHSDSERGFLHEFRSTLEKKILKDETRVIVSKIDRDPLVTV